MPLDHATATVPAKSTCRRCASLCHACDRTDEVAKMVEETCWRGAEEPAKQRPGTGHIPGLTTPRARNNVPDSQGSSIHGEGETGLSARLWIQNKYAVWERRVQGKGDALRRPDVFTPTPGREETPAPA